MHLLKHEKALFLVCSGEFIQLSSLFRCKLHGGAYLCVHSV